MASLGLDHHVDRGNITFSYRWWRRRVTDAMFALFGPKNPFGDVATRKTWHPHRTADTWEPGDVLITGGNKKIPIAHLPGLSGISGVRDFRIDDESEGRGDFLKDVDVEFQIDTSGRVLVMVVTQAFVKSGGVVPPRCTKDSDCGVNYRCENGECVANVDAPCLRMSVSSPIQVDVGESVSFSLNQYGGGSYPLSIHPHGPRTVSSASISGSTVTVRGTRKGTKADSYSIRYLKDGKYLEPRCDSGFQVTTARIVAPRCPGDGIPSTIVAGNTYSQQILLGPNQTASLEDVYGQGTVSLNGTTLNVSPTAYGEMGWTLVITDSTTKLRRACLYASTIVSRPCIEHECEDSGQEEPPRVKCTGGQILVNGKCKCPAGEKWSATLQKCVRGTARPRCPAGYAWDAATRKCKKIPVDHPPPVPVPPEDPDNPDDPGGGPII